MKNFLTRLLSLHLLAFDLLSWVRGGWTDKSALEKLLKLYRQRPDLQEVYPEAQRGDLGRLINWASGVAAHLWKDSSYEILRPHAPWYVHHRVHSATNTVEWEAITATSVCSANPLLATLAVMQDRTASDISNHLMTLSMLITEFGLAEIVELGTRDGNSTLAFLEAVLPLGGHVLSIDIEPCLDAKRRVREANLFSHWTFLQGDDMGLQPPAIPEKIDLLFIDTSHVYIHTIAELKKYSPYLKSGAWIALHDYVEFPGVSRAVHEFVEASGRKLHFYPFMHQNGLALLRVGISE